jgi:hypothetical protein
MSGRDLVRLLSFSSWFQSCTNSLLRDYFFLQFQYNPEWFQDEEDGDDWDLTQYRREQEEDNLAAEELRIANLALQNGDHEEIRVVVLAGEIKYPLIHNNPSLLLGARRSLIFA